MELAAAAVVHWAGIRTGTVSQQKKDDPIPSPAHVSPQPQSRARDKTQLESGLQRERTEQESTRRAGEHETSSSDVMRRARRSFAENETEFR
ncbi:unnamed protein product [Arctogadus glacialis]